MTSTTADVPNITVTKLAALEVEIQGAEDLSFNDADLVPVKTQSTTNPAQLQHLTDFCKTRSWWECATDTQGVCQFDNGSGTCVPAPRTKDMDSYYKQWLRIYGPVYANMKMIPTSKPCVKTGIPIEVVVVTERHGPVVPPKRRSIRRNVRRTPSTRLIDYSSSENEEDF